MTPAPTRHRHYISNSRESTRMFGPDWMEALSKVWWWVPPLIYLPVIAALLVHAASTLATLPLLGWTLLGLAIWTPTEYLLHRFVFHYQPSSAWGQRLHFIMHGVHHDYPSDALRLVMPPSASVPIALLFYGLFSLLLGAQAAPALMAGFLVGYLSYDLTHYAVHHVQFRNGSRLYELKRHHMRHHYNDPLHGFGVSSKFWDRVFGT